jgi:Dockerin type I domain
MKYLLSLLLASCMGNGADPNGGFTGSSPTCLKGDANKDGVVNKKDIEFLGYYINSRQNITPGGGSCKRWDMDDDGVLTDNDMRILSEMVD